MQEVAANPANKNEGIKDRILMAQGDNLDDILLNDGPLNSQSEGNDSIFGGPSQTNNIVEMNGLKARRFDPSDHRIALHLKIEKSSKKSGNNLTN